MSTQHTPHDWRTRASQYEPEAFDIVQPGLGAIALVKNEKFALLIAAAPDLLEALRGMVEMFKDAPTLEQFSYDEPPEPRTQWDYDAILMIGDARAAVAKATGEQA